MALGGGLRGYLGGSGCRRFAVTWSCRDEAIGRAGRGRKLSLQAPAATLVGVLFSAAIPMESQALIMLPFCVMLSRKRGKAR